MPGIQGDRSQALRERRRASNRPERECGADRTVGAHLGAPLGGASAAPTCLPSIRTIVLNRGKTRETFLPGFFAFG